MTAFMLACYLSGDLSAKLHFRNVNDCLYYSRYLGDQTYDSADGKQIIYECFSSTGTIPKNLAKSFETDSCFRFVFEYLFRKI